MNNVLLPVFYLPPVQWFAEFLDENNNVVFEEWENFPKQTYRNRTEIYGANGKLALIIPTRHTGSRLYKETEISYAENWQNYTGSQLKQLIRVLLILNFTSISWKIFILFRQKT